MLLKELFQTTSNPYKRVLVYYKEDEQDITAVNKPLYTIESLEEKFYEDGLAAAHILYAKYWECEVIEFKACREFGQFYEDLFVLKVLIGGPHA